MDVTKLMAVVSVLITLSIASERLVEIVKGLIPVINQENPDPVKEGWRRASIQILAVASGTFTAWLASRIPESGIGNDLFTILAFGLLASGGSAFWNTILEYLLKVKDIKETKVETVKELKAVEVEKAIEIKNLEVEKTRDMLNLPPVNA